MWLKLDAAFYGHPKIMLAGRDARDLYGAGLCWSAFYMTDGFLPVSCLARLGADAACDSGPLDIDAAVQRLLATGLWEKASGGYHIHDYLKHQSSRSKLRATAKSRAQAGAVGGDAKAKHNPSKTLANDVANGKQTSSKTLANDVAKPKHISSKPATKNVADIDIELDSDHVNPAPLPPTPAPPDPEARALEPTPLRAFPKPHEVERAATQAHPLYDPLVDLFGKPPTRDLPQWRDDLAALDDMGATPEEIPRAAVGYAAMMGDDRGRPIPMTRSALVRHWRQSLHAADHPPSDVTGGYAPQEAGIVAWSRRQGYAP